MATKRDRSEEQTYALHGKDCVEVRASYFAVGGYYVRLTTTDDEGDYCLFLSPMRWTQLRDALPDILADVGRVQEGTQRRMGDQISLVYYNTHIQINVAERELKMCPESLIALNTHAEDITRKLQAEGPPPEKKPKRDPEWSAPIPLQQVVLSKTGEPRTAVELFPSYFGQKQFYVRLMRYEDEEGQKAGTHLNLSKPRWWQLAASIPDALEEEVREQREIHVGEGFTYTLDEDSMALELKLPNGSVNSVTLTRDEADLLRGHICVVNDWLGENTATLPKPHKLTDETTARYFTYDIVSAKGKNRPSATPYFDEEDAKTAGEKAAISQKGKWHTQVVRQELSVPKPYALIMRIYAFLVADRIRRQRKENCAGCTSDNLSQRDHYEGCGNLWGDAVEEYLTTAVETVSKKDLRDAYRCIMKALHLSQARAYELAEMVVEMPLRNAVRDLMLPGEKNDDIFGHIAQQLLIDNAMVNPL